MAKIDFQLSDIIKAVAESRAAAGRFTVDAHLESLITADAAADFGVPGHLDFRSHEQLVALLHEGEVKAPQSR